MSGFLFRTLIRELPPITYVDCGAREVTRNALVDAIPGSRYVGFEPDEAECRRLNDRKRAGYRFYPQALGRSRGERTLYVTRNPACSSLLEPDRDYMDRFMTCGPFFDVMARRTIHTAALDEFLPSEGIGDVHFMELDTQGSELEILQGARRFLETTVLGLRIEVEFAPMYKRQPLFGDVDRFVREFGFSLFDLSRYRVRGRHASPASRARGQLLWGHAFYLKDHARLAAQTSRLMMLAAMAAFYGFQDYALETLDGRAETRGIGKRTGRSAVWKEFFKRKEPLYFSRD